LTLRNERMIAFLVEITNNAGDCYTLVLNWLSSN
jgi:hypothetical protein